MLFKDKLEPFGEPDVLSDFEDDNNGDPGIVD